tara:strand:+ start:2047 stop:3054 length:1008 start_codon:yes stop_codon:yes gene_type:complete
MTARSATSYRVIIVALGVPLVVTAIGLVLVSLWAPELPSTVATHWGFDGVDGVGPLWSIPILLLVVGVGVPGILYGVLAAAGGRGEFLRTHKLLAVVAAAVSVLVVTIGVGSLWLQRGLVSAQDAGDILPVLGVAALLALAVGAISWFVLPAAAPVTASERRDASPLVVEDGERLAWIGGTRLSRPLAFAVVAVVLFAALAVGTAVIASDGASAALLVIPLVLLLAVLATLHFTVRVDHRGLTVTGGVGVPRFRVPIEAIERISVVQVNPLGEFGGIGIRLGLDGRFGIVLQRGAALQIERRGGRTFVVTCGDAETAARVLATLHVRSGAGPREN